METVNGPAGTSNELAIAALIVAIILPLLSLVVSIRVGVWLHRRAMRRADEANEIATEANRIANRALQIEEDRVQRENEAFVTPVRFDPHASRVVFDVVAALPVRWVKFEFSHYDKPQSGECVREYVTHGRAEIAGRDFTGETSLDAPPPKFFFARATWQTTENRGWQQSAVYEASKDNYSFKRVSDAERGD